MIVEDEERGFDGDEAVSLHHLLDVLSLYCAESVVWWDEGQGTPRRRISRRTGPASRRSIRRRSRSKSGSPSRIKKPKYKVPEDHMVALAKQS